jgi:hypothetical protein
MMPMFLCPCCGESYLVPLAFCEFILEERIRQGWKGMIAPARCLSCQTPVSRGVAVVLRGGAGVSREGKRQDLPVGGKATVVEVSSWEGEGSIFLVRLTAGNEVYVARAQITPESAAQSGANG